MQYIFKLYTAKKIRTLTNSIIINIKKKYKRLPNE